MEKDPFTFDEAIDLFRVGAHGFNFTNQRGGDFASQLDTEGRILIVELQEEES